MSSKFLRPGSALITCGTMLTHIAIVPTPPGISGSIAIFSW